MNERELEQRLEAFYRAEVTASGPVPDDLYDDVFSIPAASTPVNPRRTMLLLAAMVAVLLAGGMIAVAAGLLRLPDDDDQVFGRENGWIAYVVALTEWNTPGGPTYETLIGPSRIALVRDGTPSPIYLSGVNAPQAGDSTNAWLSVRQQCPAFSPDGSKLAYHELSAAALNSAAPWTAAGSIVISTIGPNGPSTSVPDVRIDGVRNGACPVWAPDGQHIAFPDPGPDEIGGSIVVAGLDGSRRDLPAAYRVSRTVGMSWSPDGQTLATIDRGFSNGTGVEGSLWLTPVDGTKPRLLHRARTELAGIPSWSPDGGRIAITAAASSEPSPADDDWHVLLVPLDGSTLEDIGVGTGGAWSADGGRLAFLARPGRSAEPTPGRSIVVLELSNGHERVVPPAPIAAGTELSDYHHGGGTGFWQPHEPSWSPDGEALLFMGSDGTWGTTVMLSASADGTEPPQPVSESWVAEWYGQNPFSWQPKWR